MIDIGRFAAARDVLDEAATAAERAGNEQLEAAARLTHLLLELRAGKGESWSDRAIPEIEHAVEIFTAAGDDAGLAKAWRLLGYVHGTACRYGDAAHACERAMEHAGRAGDGREERINATSYALAACWGPTPVDEAIARCEKVLTRVEASRISCGWVTCILGQLGAMRCDFEDARSLCRDGRAQIEGRGEGWY